MIDLLRKEPHSRRNVMTALDPQSVDRAALPPCHMMVQALVEADGTLALMVTMRSADLGLGLPFNMLSYGLLAHVLASMCGRTASKLVFSLGSMHVYSSHKEALEKQLQQPRGLQPLVVLKPFSGIDALTPAHFDICNYAPSPAVHMEMQP